VIDLNLETATIDAPAILQVTILTLKREGNQI
jgi:hypothetical protein